MQVILDSSFARQGSAPIRGGKKGEFRDWTICYVVSGCCNRESPIFINVFVASFCDNRLKLFCIYFSSGLPFTVNETTGDIKTTGKLDRETNSSFTLVIIVRIKYYLLSLLINYFSFVRKMKKNWHPLLLFSSVFSFCFL